MPTPRVHLCLVYNTPTSNVTPALDPAFRPEEVILMHAPRETARARHLAEVLGPAGIKVSFWPVEYGRDIRHIRDRVLELLVERESDSIALNASGGTRPMTLGAYEVFREFDRPVFFVDPETDHLSWMHRRDLEGFDVGERIGLAAFFKAHGATLEQQGERGGVPKRLRRLGDELVAHAEELSRPLATLNWLASRAEGELVSPELSREQLRWRELMALCERFEKESLLVRQGGRLQFESEDARFFVNGGWLEQFVFGVVFGLRSRVPGLQDAGHSLTLSRGGSGRAVRNELDVAFLASNRLYIIECKTRRFAGQGGGRDAPGAAALYKLDTLKNLLGGERSRIMLASYQAISPWDRQRARDLGVGICTAKRLPDLASILERWIRSDVLP